MNELGKRRSEFPFYLNPGPSTKALFWLGSRLRRVRGRNSVAPVARRTGISESELKLLEEGIFHVSVGRLRDIVQRGYHVDFAALLEECYEVNQSELNQRNDSMYQNRPFTKDFLYLISLRGGVSDRFQTPLLIGGDPESFIWGIPMRRLRDQPMVSEFLELAPRRKKKDSGHTPLERYDGIAFLHLIYGTIFCEMNRDYNHMSRTLTAGDSIHFLASNRHQFTNASSVTSALSFIIHLPEHRPTQFFGHKLKYRKAEFI